MPRKTKEQKELEIEKKVNEKTDKTEKKSTSTTPKKASQKKSTKTVAKTSTGKKRTATTKATTSKAATAKATTKATSKKTVTEKTVEETKKVTKKSTSTSTTKKASKTATKKPSSTAKTTRKKKVSNPKDKKIDIVEYYDLPYRYNQTVVKLLAQTPKEDFFETTRPVLIVHNDSLNYSFEVEINDFANSWYLHVSDSKCDYRIELGRRPIQKTEKLNTDYIYISASNEIESPNDRILFNKEQKMVYFRNVKTGEQTSKPINTLSFIRNMGKIYNIYDIYKAIYQDENIEELYDLSNPSSGNPSSR